MWYCKKNFIGILYYNSSKHIVIGVTDCNICFTRYCCNFIFIFLFYFSIPILTNWIIYVYSVISCIFNSLIINTFASLRLVFEGINEQFLLGNASNLYDNFSVKIAIQKLIIHFQGEIVPFFPQKQAAEKRKC